MQIHHDPQHPKRSKELESRRSSGGQSPTQQSAGFQQVFAEKAEDIRPDYEVLLNTVEDKGNALAAQPSEATLVAFTQAVRQFIRKAQGQSTVVDKNYDKHNRLYTMVREVDTHLAELTDQVLYKHQKTINLAAKIHEIRGILLDMFI